MPATPVPPPPVLPAAPPPFPPPPPLPPEQPKLSRALGATFVLVGVVQFLLGIIAPPGRWTLDNAPLRLGGLLGATAVWPLIVLGLFSIGRSFRNPRSRAIIVMVVWSLFCMAHLSSLSQQRARQLRFRGPDPKPVAAKTETKSEPAIDPLTARPSPAPLSDLGAETKPEPTHDDFTRGSDERLIKLIEQAQEHRYHAVVAAYAEACKARPRDATLALERVRFIEHFLSAEDITIESASADLQMAVDDLKRRFPNAPATVLYELENLFDDDFEPTARRYAHLVGNWSAADRSRFFLLRANAANLRGDNADVKIFAKLSFTADPTTEAALLLARHAHQDGKSAETLTYLRHTIMDAALPWQKKQKMDLLFDLAQPDAAAALYDEIVAASPPLVNNGETAMRLARGGRIEAARKILADLPLNPWNGERLARQRFAFELDFGSAQQAADAYRALRETGIAADPFLRDRVRLLLKHPRAGWSINDVIGLLLLGLLFIAAVFLPLVVLIPVHYWSLLRQHRRALRLSSAPGWGLRQAWIALSVLCVTEVATLWALQPEWLHTWWNDAVTVPALPDRELLVQQSLVWLALAGVLILLLWGADKWPLFRSGRWRTGKIIGMALGATLLLRITLLAYAIVWPEAVFEPVASFDAQTRQLCLALLKTTGPFGLIAAIAVLVPILEELLFRGVLLDALTKHIPFGWANVLQAIAFAAVHEHYRIFPFYVAFGILAGLLTRRSGSLLPATIMHGCNNLLAAFVILAQQRLAG